MARWTLADRTGRAAKPLFTGSTPVVASTLPRATGASRVRLAADDEGLDVVPAVAVGGFRDALLEFSEEVGEEAGSACLALAREGTEEAAVRTALRRLSSHGAGVLAMRDSRGSQDKSKGVFRVVVEP